MPWHQELMKDVSPRYARGVGEFVILSEVSNGEPNLVVLGYHHSNVYRWWGTQVKT